MKSIADIPKYKTEIYVLGSGRTIDYIREGFFDDKVTIGINTIHKHFPVKIGIAHHTSLIQEMIDKGIIAVTPEYDMGLYSRERAEMRGEYYVYKHKNNTLYDFPNNTGYTDIDMTDFDNPETLVVGGVTTSAIHLAYKLGATSIFLCGIDGGFLDGWINYTKHPNGQVGKQHILEMQPQIDLIANKIRSLGIGVYSINPFTNLRLEGHKYESE